MELFFWVSSSSSSIFNYFLYNVMITDICSFSSSYRIIMSFLNTNQVNIWSFWIFYCWLVKSLKKYLFQSICLLKIQFYWIILKSNSIIIKFLCFMVQSCCYLVNSIIFPLKPIICFISILKISKVVTSKPFEIDSSSVSIFFLTFFSFLKGAFWNF